MHLLTDLPKNISWSRYWSLQMVSKPCSNQKYRFHSGQYLHSWGGVITWDLSLNWYENNIIELRLLTHIGILIVIHFPLCWVSNSSVYMGSGLYFITEMAPFPSLLYPTLFIGPLIKGIRFFNISKTYLLLLPEILSFCLLMNKKVAIVAVLGVTNWKNISSGFKLDGPTKVGLRGIQCSFPLHWLSQPRVH